MLYKRGDKILVREGKFLENKTKTLTFQVEGDSFPNAGMLTLEGLENDVVVDYGDGTIVSKAFYPSRNTHAISFNVDNNTGAHEPETLIPKHTYTDGFNGRRTITLTFSIPKNLRTIGSVSLPFYERLPPELNILDGLVSIQFVRTYYITNLDLNLNKNLKSLSFKGTVSALIGQIPDSIFQSNLEILFVHGVFDLSNLITSNFFKINQLKDQLVGLDITNSNHTSLPESIRECTLLSNLKCGSEFLEEIPLQLESLINLVSLYIGSSIIKKYTLVDFSNHNKLGTLIFTFSEFDYENIPTKWSGLTSLFRILGFGSFTNTQSKYDAFVDNFYILCTNEGSIVEDPNAFGGVYPNRFRDILWGSPVQSPTEIIQAPAGFVLGSANGTPANQGEKIYVLKENYGHIITTAQP